MTTTELTTHPEVPDSSLYLSCLDLAIRSFANGLDSSESVTDRADAFFDALRAKTTQR